MTFDKAVPYICLVIACIKFVQADDRCPKGTFYDKVTNRCDSCADICINSRTQGTEENCKQFCPDYNPPTDDILTTTVCPEDQYYDSVVKRCDYCSVLCDDSDIQGTTNDCKQKCPKYFASLVDDIPIAKITPTCPEDQYYDSVIQRCSYCSELCDDYVIQGTTDGCKQNCPKYLNKHSPVNDTTSTPAGLIALAVICLILVVLLFLYALMMFCCEERLPYYLRLETCFPCVLKPKRPVECTEASTPTTGSSRSSLESDAPPEQCQVLIDQPQSGFTDMQYRRQCSSDVSNT